MTSYAEFRLRIERGTTTGSYRVVASGMGADASGQFTLPFGEMELENLVLKLGRTRRGKRRIDSPEMALARSFGTRLFDAVFAGDVRELYRSARAEASDLGQGLRLTLALTGAPELLQVPWEFLYDRPTFLSISTWTPIVRYLDLPKPPRPLEIAYPLRVLGMVSAPSDAEKIEVAEERAKLEAALAVLVESGVVAIDWLEQPNLLALARQLRRADYHVFHFIGHGGFDAESSDGALLFEDEHGRSERVSGAQLGDILHDEKSLRLAVLNACEGARTGVDDPFTGVATSLIEREIPAAIGMQFEITDKAAIVFASEFYSTLADGQPVDAAISEARKSIYAMGNDIEWGTPVLFMRVQDGRLFDVQPHPPVPRPDPVAIAEAATTSGVGGEGALDGGRAGPAAAEPDRRRAEADERDRMAEQDRLEAAAEEDRLRVEAEARARTAAERERQAAEIAERERLAAAERERGAAEAAGREREAAKIADGERQAAATRARAAAEAEELSRRLAAMEASRAHSRPAPRIAGTEQRPERSPPPVVAREAAHVSRRSTTRRRGGLRGGWVWLVFAALALTAVGTGGFIAAAGSSPPERPAATARGSTPAPTDDLEVVRVRPPNVYNAPKDDGLARLRDAGFTRVSAIPVCSGSVKAGFIRQVVIDDGSAAGSERILVDKAGSLRDVAPSTPLLVKVGTGKACS